MIIVDDLLFKPLVSMVDVLHSLAVDEMYDVAGIQDELKETHLLYELGELSDEEYEERKATLETRLDVAETAHERLRNGKVEVKR
ncbi:protein gvpG [Haladaptatus sp. W1]|uniref:gas vesicle protein GvpG n=1 Tax=unclassified Haladaptatus TaxID=2622732 RepID=UPI0008498245|nr:MULTISPECIES: protein gvpG [unclassified Haladaptatus]ODR81412.1 protein gvpG [Haladaptatus sp. W1]GKZ12204.1 protein gvpG [Haladaptatus sp. T7]